VVTDARPGPDTPPAARICRVTADYAPVYADPIRFRAGDEVTLTGREDNWQGYIWLWGIGPDGREGWLPQNAVTAAGDRGVARYDYDARELPVTAGDEVRVERSESGWLWCAGPEGNHGWVPAGCVSCPDLAG
jgi:Variant SH3 domain